MFVLLLILFILVPIAELALIIQVGGQIGVLAQRLRAEGLAVRLRGAQPQVRRLIELVGLDRQPAVAVEFA